MPTPTRGRRMGGSSAHQKSILANQASDLFRHGRIKTTEAKAKMLRPYAEKLITKAKAGDLHSRRQVLASIKNKDVTAYLFEEIAPRFADRPGGYTRILKLGPRQGDSTRMALIELVDRGDTGGSADEVIEEGKAKRGRGLFGRRAKATGAVAVAERELDEVSDVSEASESSDSVDEVAEASAPAVDDVVDEVVDADADADKA